MSLLVDVTPPTAVVRLNRPEVRNALSNDVLAELVGTLERLEQDGIRCTVVAGSESVFAAGADLRALAEARSLDDYLGERHGHLDRLSRVRMPIVAAVAGYCLGAGFELALACDIVVAAENAQFGLPETGLGLIPGAGGTQRLPRVVGTAKAMDVILGGRRLSAAEAEASGIAARVVPVEELEAAACRLAEQIASRSAVAQRLAKEMVRSSFDASLDAGIEAERHAFALALASRDAAEGIAAFLEKRTPVWEHV